MPIAQGGPVHAWVTDWVEFLQGSLPLIYWLVVVVIVTLIMIRKGNQKKKIMGGIKGAIVFSIAAAFVYFVLVNMPVLSGLFGEELPIDAK